MVATINPAKKRRIRLKLGMLGNWDIDTSRPEAKKDAAKGPGLFGAAARLKDREKLSSGGGFGGRVAPTADTLAWIEREASRRGGTEEEKQKRVVEYARSQGLSGSDVARLGGVGDVGDNAFTRDFGNIVKGLPRLGYLVAKESFLLPVRAPVSLIRGEEPSFSKNLVRPFLQSYADKYGPILPGGRPIGETWEQVKEQPVSTGLDAGALLFGGFSAGAKAGRFARAPGTLKERLVASRETPERMLKTGETEVWMPSSPNAATLAGQRGYDRLSGFLENARREGKLAPIVENVLDPLTADVRGARQFERLSRQVVRRAGSSFARSMRTVNKMPEEARGK